MFNKMLISYKIDYFLTVWVIEEAYKIWRIRLNRNTTRNVKQYNKDGWIKLKIVDIIDYTLVFLEVLILLWNIK